MRGEKKSELKQSVCLISNAAENQCFLSHSLQLCNMNLRKELSIIKCSTRNNQKGKKNSCGIQRCRKGRDSVNG